MYLLYSQSAAGGIGDGAVHNLGPCCGATLVFCGVSGVIQLGRGGFWKGSAWA